MVFGFIFFVARGCVATQQSTEVRKYVTSADSLLSDSSNAGRGELQRILSSAGGDPEKLDEEALAQVTNRSESHYLQALRQEEIPPEFEDAHHYVVTALGIRSEATERLEQAASGDASGFGGELATAIEDYRTSDSIIANYYIPAVKGSLEVAGQTSDQGYLEEPQSFMDYGALGFDVAPVAGTGRSDPNALHGVQISAVKVAGKPLYQDGNVVLTGADEPIFAVTVGNGGEATETGIEVEVIVNTSAERQSRSKTIARLEPKKTTTVDVGGFIPGELDETARVTVEAGPVEYEKTTSNNTITGTVTFGM
ncbi:MAG TPA: CARDB domain-containing protein [Rubrobacter sp.]|nr:CARDB domain-containing protein [Rubrobacter sp.]